MSHNESDNHKYIFVGGLHRSGTWLLTECLENHPEISRLGTVDNTPDAGDIRKHEGQFLQTVYPSDHYYGGVGRLGFHREAHLTEQSPLVTDDNRFMLRKEWYRYWNTTCPYLLEKTPSNLLRTRFLQAMFEDTQFILIMRHPVAVALAQQKWSGTSLTPLIEHWLICYETLFNDLPYLDRYHFLRYEDFIIKPAEHLNRTFSFLGLDPIESSEEVKRDGNERYFKIWDNALQKKDSRDSILYKLIKRSLPFAMRHGYSVVMLLDEIDMIINRFEDRVLRFGYSLKDLRLVKK